MGFLKSLSIRFKQLLGRAPEDDYEDYDYDEGQKGVGDFLVGVLLLPLKILFSPFRLLVGMFHDTGVSTEYLEGDATWKSRLLRIGRAILMIPLRIVTAPQQLFRDLFEGNLKDALFVLPALAMVLLFAFVFLQVFARHQVIENRYKRAIDSCYKGKEFEKAKTYFHRLMETTELTLPQRYQYALTLIQSGEIEKGVVILDELAPDDRFVYAPAHTARAIDLSTRLGNTNDPEILKKLRWHLQNSRSVSVETQVAWAKYHVALGEHSLAVKALQKVADESPQIYEEIAMVQALAGQHSDKRATLRDVEKIYRDKLSRDKLNRPALVSLVRVLSKLEELDEAESLLLESRRIQPDAAINRVLSDFYVVRHDISVRDEMSATKQLDYLIRAIRVDPNFPPVYQRIMAMYEDSAKSKEKGEEIYQTLLEVVAGDEPSPMAHFVLSNVLWGMDEKVKAQFHIERAYEINPSFVIVLNNLAWMLAHAENPDLDRALELSQVAVNQRPADPRFHDTLGTIFLKKNQFKLALKEFEIALPKVPANEKKEIHRKLAVVYQELGMDDLSMIHQKQGN
jgi:tetratricopeptide (TPR) repeat protein